MEYRILGPLEAIDDGRRVTLGTAKQQLLLGVLLLHANETVPRDRLVDALWGERPPATADKAVQIYVSQLRKCLPNGEKPLVTRGGGYVLAVAREHVDAHRFDDLVGEARDSVSRGALEDAVERYDEALALWRGPVLEGLAAENSLRAELAQLDEERLSAVLEKVDCELALGRHGTVVAELERLVAEHPLNERLRGQLMLALYRSGRQTDALRVYRDLRETLVEELGLEPGTPLLRLERAILSHDAALEAPAGLAATTRHVPAPASRRSRPRVLRHLRRPRRFLIAAFLAGVGVAALAAALAATGGSRGAQRLRAIPANAVGLVDPRTNAITTSISLGSAPVALAARDGAVWVAEESDRSVARIDARTRAVHVVAVPGHPSNLAITQRTLWVADGAEQTVFRIDPRRSYAGRPVRPTRTPPETRALAVAPTGRGAWVAAPPLDVVRLDATGRVRARRTLDAGVLPAAALVGGRVWIGGSHVVTPIDARTGVPASSVALAGNPVALAPGFGSLWALSDSAVQRIDPGVGVVLATVPVGRNAAAIATGGGAVWVANASTGTISRIDPRRDSVVKTISVGHSPVALAFAHGVLWVGVR